MRGLARRTRRGTTAIAVAVGALLCFAPASQAAFGLTPTATPSSNNAGANADLKIDIAITEPSHDLKDLTIHLPPGLVGNPLATPQCTEEQLNADMCPPDSDVGDVSNDVTLMVGVTPVNQTVTGNLYNVVPHAGEPARFGIVLSATPLPVPGAILPKIILQSAAALRPSDLGLDSILKDLPNSATVLGTSTPIDVNSLSLTLSGMAGNPPKGFIRLPTSCKTHTVGFDARTYDDQTATAQTTFDTTNCGALPFTPELSARIKRVGPVNNPVELSTTIAQTIEEAGLRKATVILPVGLGGNNETLAHQCTQASFEAGSCPADSIVGSAAASSPLQSEGLSGTVALVQPATPGLPDLGIDLRGPLALKLKGTLGFTLDGRNIVVFDNLPDIPIDAFTLTFAGGEGGLTLPARDVCVPPPVVFDATFDSHSGGSLTSTATATVDCSGATDGGGGGGGGGGGTKKPKAKIKVGREGSDEPTLALKITAGSEKLKSAAVKLPKQLGFASGKAFDQGTDLAKVSVTHTKRTLKLKSKKAVKRFAAKFANGAVKPGKGLGPNTKLTFKLKVRDAKGKTTKLKVRAK